VTDLDARAERQLRELAPQVLGAVIRRFRDFGASEDAVQEALLAAAAPPRCAHGR
jgi:predicted RNA polymerase sigma factor